MFSNVLQFNDTMVRCVFDICIVDNLDFFFCIIEFGYPQTTVKITCRALRVSERAMASNHTQVHNSLDSIDEIRYRDLVFFSPIKNRETKRTK